MMVLLTVIAVGLLSLSTLSVKSMAQADAQQEAQANARMALMLALDELQLLAGSDTRITAGSDLVDASNVRATGVWRSWEGIDRDSAGKPVPPDYALKTKPGDAQKALGSASEGRFLGWLASPLANAYPDVDSLAGLSSSPSPGSVPLVASGSVMDPSQEVHAVATMASNNGGFAWWVSGDNSKAMLNVDPIAKPTTTVAWHTRMKSNGKADPESFGLEKLDELPINKRIPSRATLQLVDGTVDIRKFHDLSEFSCGLLTNSATGGWRKDLSLLSENYAALPEFDLPSLTLKPGTIQTFSKARTSTVSPYAHPPNALLYPWALYRQNFANTQPWRQVPPINSWSALTDFMLQYRSLSSSSSAKTTMPYNTGSFSIASQRFQYQEQVRRAPVIARIQWIFSLCSRPMVDPADPTNTHQAALLVTPVVTLWNPYNVEISLPGSSGNAYGMTFDHIAPLSFRFKVGNTLYPDTTLYSITKSAASGYLQNFHLAINTAITLAPGATRIFGIDNNVPLTTELAKAKTTLRPGYQPNGGQMFYGLNNGADVYGKAGDTFAVEEFAFNGTTAQGTNTGLGMYMEFWVNNQGSAGQQTNFNGHRMVYDKAVLGGDAVVDALYPTVSNTISSTLQEVEGVRNKPFVGAIFGFKPATPRPNEAKFNNLHTKGMLNTHPLTFYSEVGAKAVATGYAPIVSGTGGYHPANAPYEFSFQDVNGWNDTQAIPQFEPGSNSGYIVSGLTAGDGLTRCVMAELPTRPLQSLAELQHFDARNNNPIPPFQFNLIGNGSANPIFAPSQLTVGAGNSFCNDDTFILNHLLFDDWFVSSIAPELDDFSKTEKRSIAEVYQDQLESKTPLANRFYRPAPGADPTFSVTSSSKSPVTDMYAYETVASQLEVEGMINVNSVSVDAWKAWLRQGRNAKTPFLAANGSTQLDVAKSFAFPRTTIAGDSAADSGSNSSNPLFPDAAEFTGYRTLTDTQIDALAEEIVNEIRKRGPFLSLSEFVNRRLTTDKSLAAAGTIQQALDTLANSSDSSKNPFKKLQDNAVEITTTQPGPTDHKFPEAAFGSSAFGVPGWIRQADILTRLAPMLSVRDDTFTIRAYGDARGKDGAILARAWCEAVVCRRADYVDSIDPKEIIPHSTAMQSAANRRFGRRFEVISFRWLHASEV